MPVRLKLRLMKVESNRTIILKCGGRANMASDIMDYYEAIGGGGGIMGQEFDDTGFDVLVY